ncbi:MAG: Nif3-like dinuclear metal center hexameric protein [Defluviitaleaceae bacterium]|nr:Nif3-like dinuclear metal center hexameric protein [Defluviitaleaceae bacterium]
MAVNTKWVMSVMEKFAPECLAYDNDNVGLLVGEQDAPISKVLVALELTNDVLDEAIEVKANLIVAHHPIMRNPIKRVTDETLLGQKIIKLIKNEISLFVAHTNLDAAPGGVNDALFEILGLSNQEPLMILPHAGRCEHIASDSKISPSMGRIGELLAPMKTSELAAIVKKRLNLNTVNYVGDANKIISKVGICTGSGSSIDFIESAIEKGCDVLISGDVTHHNAQTALELGIVLIDGTHYATEAIITDVIADKIKEAAIFENIYIDIVKSTKQKSPLQQA